MAKMIDRKKMNSSQNAHLRLKSSARNSGNVIKEHYHQNVFSIQSSNKCILSKKGRKQVYEDTVELNKVSNRLK